MSSLQTYNNLSTLIDQFPQTAQFLLWYKKEKEKGLVDIKFVTADLDGTTLESFFSEVNEMLNSKSVEDPELF